MSEKTNRDDQYLSELLAGKVLGDLSADELPAFGELFSTSHSEQLEELERVAAALHYLALADQQRPELPDFLRQRIIDASLEQIVPTQNLVDVPQVGQTPRVQAPSVKVGKFQSSPSVKLREICVWVALAATMLLAVQLWWTNRSKELEPASARLAFLSETSDRIQVDWSSGKTPFEAPVTGDVVWSNAKQEGYLRFVGMPPNNPAQQQYQLWIIDPARDAEPIDGGVFDIAGEGEIVVPIRAKLKVLQPAAFAITIEQPGGVVVSTQERLPLIAQLPKR